MSDDPRSPSPGASAGVVRAPRSGTGSIRGGSGAGRPERRRYPRAITDFSAELKAGGQRYAARVINLSMGGALLDLRRAVPAPVIAVGAHVWVEIGCRGGDEPFATEGKVVAWNHGRSGERGSLLALQFDEVHDEETELLEELMAEAWAEIRGRALCDAIP